MFGSRTARAASGTALALDRKLRCKSEARVAAHVEPNGFYHQQVFVDWFEQGCTQTQMIVARV
jgi:hypothetical protein